MVDTTAYIITTALSFTGIILTIIAMQRKSSKERQEYRDEYIRFKENTKNNITQHAEEFKTIKSDIKDFKEETRKEFDNVKNDIKELKQETRKEFDNVKSDIKELRQETQRDINRLKDDLTNVKVEIAGIKTDISSIKEILTIQNKEKIEIMSYKNSPAVLNEIGKRVFNDLVGDEFFNEHLDLFINELEKIKPPTALDVEEKAFSVLMSLSSNPIFYDVKTKIYNYPEIEKPDGSLIRINMVNVCDAMSIPLRDEYLKRHPEIKTE